MYVDIKICLDISTITIDNSDRRKYLLSKRETGQQVTIKRGLFENQYPR
jgi:hypothetical protein